MASYDLKCRSCGNEFEVFVLGFLKNEAKVCPECGGREVEQRFTGFGGVIASHRSGEALCADTGQCEPHRCASSSGFG